MFRFALFLICFAYPALAQDGSELCAVTSQIAGDAAAGRAAGKDQASTTADLTDHVQATHAAYTAAVEPIVGWVWTLPEDQLTAGVAEAYSAACLAQ